MITFIPEISIGDLLLVISIMIAAVGLFFNLLEMKINNRQKRAEYMINLYNQYASDHEMMDIFYKIEHKEFKYDKDLHQQNEEKKLDKLLGFFTNIARLYLTKNITLEDLKFFAYEFLVVYRDESVGKYLESLDSWCKNKRIPITLYKPFINVGEILEREFSENDRDVTKQATI